MSKLAGIDFVEPLSEEFNCPICFGLLQDPFLTACCGNHFCESCADKVKKNNNKCPLCQDTPLDGIVNKGLKRKVNELKVYCTHKNTGCDWKGNFGKLDLHLAADKVDGDCQFVIVRCPVSTQCETKISRKLLENHIKNVCGYRQFNCIHCGYQSTYYSITTSHNNECLKYPVPCPNNCSTKTHPRSLLNSHLALCPEQEVACTFNEMGCKEKMKRRLLQEHMETNLLNHQVNMSQAYTMLLKDKKQLEEKVADLEQRVTKPSYWPQEFKLTIKKERKIDWPLYLAKISAISFVYPVAPVVLEVPFVVTRSTICSCGRSGSWLTAKSHSSFPFYSHPNGYKLQLSAKLVNHCPACVMQYLKAPSMPPVNKLSNSVSVDIQLMEGEQDHELKWPFKRQISITLLSKLTDSNHHRIEINCEGDRNEKLRLEKSGEDAKKLLQQQFDEVCQALSSGYLQSQKDQLQLDLYQKFHELMEPNSLFFPFDDIEFPEIKPKSTLAAKRQARLGQETSMKLYFELAVCYL